MRRWTKVLKRMPAVLVCSAVLFALPEGAETGPRLKVTPSVIKIGTFYGGGQVRVDGIAEADSKVVVVVRGPSTEEVFKKKGRVGPIWITRGKVHISGVPSLLLSLSSEPVDQFLDRAVMDKYQLDHQAIRAQMKVEPELPDLETVKQHYLELKADVGVYATVSNAVKMGSPTAEGVPYSVVFSWPKKAPPASYDVRAYECRDGSVIRQSHAPLEVVKVGFPAFLSNMAKERAPLYGVMSVIIALIAGFGIDFLAARLGRKGPIAH